MKQSLSSAEKARDQYHQLYLETLERCRKLERGLLGQKSERTPHDEAQLSLGMLRLLLNKGAEQAEESSTTPVKPHERQRPTGASPCPRRCHASTSMFYQTTFNVEAWMRTPRSPKMFQRSWSVAPHPWSWLGSSSPSSC